MGIGRLHSGGLMPSSFEAEIQVRGDFVWMVLKDIGIGSRHRVCIISACSRSSPNTSTKYEV